MRLHYLRLVVAATVVQTSVPLSVAAAQTSPFTGFVNATGLPDALRYCKPSGVGCHWNGPLVTFGTPHEPRPDRPNGPWTNLPVPGGTPVTNQFIADGVWFSSGLSYMYGWTTVPGINGGWLTNAEPVPDGGVTPSFSLHFTRPVSSAAFGFATAHAFTTLTAYIRGTEVGRSTWNSDFDRRDIAYRGFVPNMQYTGRLDTFDEIRVTFSHPVVAWLDNVQYETTVPEPGTSTLLLVGMILAGAARARQRFRGRNSARRGR